MKRREFIALLGCVAVTWPVVGRAQQGRKIPRIGVLWHAGSAEEEGTLLNALRQGFSDLGYVEGKTIELENRFAAEEYERFNSLAVELVRLKVDVLVAVTLPAALAAQRATTTMPVVFVLVANPVRSKLVDSLARPGRNLTGLSHIGADLIAKRLEFFKEVVVGLSRAALLVNPRDQENTRRNVEEVQAAATILNVTIRPVEVRSPGDLEAALSAIAQDRFDGVILGNDAMLFNERRRIAELALARGLPTSVFTREMVESGGLMSYATNVPTLFRRAAAYVDKILKGAKPTDLPVEFPTKFELVINLKTAKALGLTVPPSLLARADEVIE
jgi:putative ABC transport system substrate-binding protein